VSGCSGGGDGALRGCGGGGGARERERGVAASTGGGRGKGHTAAAHGERRTRRAHGERQRRVRGEEGERRRRAGCLFLLFAECQLTGTRQRSVLGSLPSAKGMALGKEDSLPSVNRLTLDNAIFTECHL
jgi:hypothetical protein